MGRDWMSKVTTIKPSAQALKTGWILTSKQASGKHGFNSTSLRSSQTLRQYRPCSVYKRMLNSDCSEITVDQATEEAGTSVMDERAVVKVA
jgi:hypothetical protein